MSQMKKILVIEDEQSVRDVILDILGAEDFFAIGAENGLVGVQMAQEQAPDLIICDMMMPELDGCDVLVKLRQNPMTATIPFIFLTAKAEKADLREGMELGADDYLTKPFTRSELLGAIAGRLDKQDAIDKQSQKKLDALRSSITLSLPHEIYTPLSGLLNLSKMLLDEYDVMEGHEILEVAEGLYTSSQRLHRVIQNFLLYAQLEIAATDPEKVRSFRSGSILVPEGLITDVATQKAHEADREADLQLELKNTALQVSETKLKKIVEELVDNAFKFSSPGTPVRVATVFSNSTLTLYVIDHGRGMTPDQIANVGAYMQFERRLHEQQGSGLGLTIAKRLAELQGGELTIESIPGKQTTVRVMLPG